jgi:hypothetical protein
MTWCPCVENLQSFCSVHAPPTPAEAGKVLKLQLSRDKWRAYAERLEKQVEKLRFVELKYTITSAPLVPASVSASPMTAGELQARKELGEARAELYRLRNARDGWMERYEKALECNRQLSQLIDEERAATRAEIRTLRLRARCGAEVKYSTTRCTLELGHLGTCGAFP